MRNVSILALAGVFIALFYPLAPVVEGRIFPVVTGTEINRTEGGGDGSTRIWGVSDRRRDCRFVGLEWRLGNRERYSVIAVTFEEGNKVRDAGGFSFGPWLVTLTPAQISENSYAVARHRCHWLWDTESQFYPLE